MRFFKREAEPPPKFQKQLNAYHNKFLNIFNTQVLITERVVDINNLTEIRIRV